MPSIDVIEDFLGKDWRGAKIWRVKRGGGRGASIYLLQLLLNYVKSFKSKIMKTSVQIDAHLPKSTRGKKAVSR